MTRIALRRLATGVLAGLAALFIGVSALAYATPRLKPPAPGPEYLSRADHALLLSLAEMLKRKRFADAKAQTTLITDPIAKSLATWMYFMAQDPNVGLGEADAFLDAHSDWPMLDRIQRFVESRIPATAPADDVLAFFDARDPVSGDGKVALARAQFAKGDQQAGESHLRDAWINHNFTVANERRILSAFGGRLREQDHAARVDRLLWSRQVTNARRVFSRLSDHEREKATVRAAMLMRAADGPRLYSKLSQTDQLDPGVLHAALRYYRRSGDQPMAVMLSRKAPNDPVALRYPERLWYERRLLMRWALKERRFADAYEIAARHGLDDGLDLAEAEFNAGWIALRFLDQPERAEAHFLALASTVNAPISLARAFYWAGRAKAAQGDPAGARPYYEKAAPYFYSFYGQLAAEKLGGEAMERRFEPAAAASAEDKALFTSRPAVIALRMLADLNLEYEFMVFSYRVDDQLERPGEYVELARIANGEGAPHLTVRAGKAAVRRGAFAADVSYPLIYLPEDATRYIAPEIILGLSRQESEFNPRAFSRAGARGVMQLIPSTALLTARKEGMRYSRTALLDDPVYNITLGSAHLSHLMERYDGSLIMTLAAYNAGVSRVEQWVGDYGDPRNADIDPLDWIEMVPFQETRNYIQRVLENIQVYRGRLTNAPIPGRLAGDIESGGANRRVARASNAPITPANVGTLSIAPLPERTAMRAAAFKIAMAAAEAPPAPPADETAVNPAASESGAGATDAKRRPSSRATDRRSRRMRDRSGAAPREAPPPANPSATEEPASDKTDAAAMTEDEAAAPTPIAAVADAPAAVDVSIDAAPAPQAEDAAATQAGMEPLAMTADTPIDMPADAPEDAQADAQEDAAGEISLANPLPQDDAESQALDAIAVAAPVAASAAPFADPDDPDLPDDLDPAEYCRAYRAFLARNAEAGDETEELLNASMRVELQRGPDGCE